MLSDEEKNVIDLLKNIDKQKCLMLNCPVVKNNIERQLKIIELNRIIRKQQKEIEELKERNNPQPDCEEPIERTEEMVNMKWVNHNYILKTESEQRERKAYIKGTNDADELCNKKWKDKIKAKIEEIEKLKTNDENSIINKIVNWFINQMQSLLEKE